MSLLGRFLGGDRSNAFAEGMTLLEAGRFAQAADRLRIAALGRSDSASGSLASFHFRQALVNEGRRLMRLGRFPDALDGLSEAVRLWENYPDLHCLYGSVLAQVGDLDQALQEALFALRLNPDYSEARLLKAVVLEKLGRNRESADSLNTLIESGRRVDHWLIDTFGKSTQYTQDQLPPDMIDHLIKSLSGESEKEEVAAGVALCREGDWTKGLEIFASLVSRRPRYPDYRTRHAAALFQLGRQREALLEVEAALALNESYGMAIDLKGLILADSGQLLAARIFLHDADKNLAGDSRAGAHEELFGSYLRGVLALLTGQAGKVADYLNGWPDLLRTFARAELLQAAADDLLHRPSACGRRLTDLADEWTDESLYFELLAYHHLGQHHFGDVGGVLARWPGAARKTSEYAYLQGLLALSRHDHQAGQWKAPEHQKGDIAPEAWQFLVARAAYQSGDDTGAWKKCQALMENGIQSERLVRLQTAAAASDPDLPEVGWQPPKVVPDSCLAQLVYFDVGRGKPERAVAAVESTLRIHPDCLTARWLKPEFWLGPIRTWIA